MTVDSITATSPKGEPTEIPCLEPGSLRPLGTVPVDDADAVKGAIVAARAAQRIFARSTFAERRELLGHILDHILDHADELCEVVVRDSGKTLENAMMGEIWPLCEKLRWTIRHGEKHLRPERVSSGMLVHKKATIEFRPLGVVGVICPWNYPLQNILGPVIPALMAGNGCVVKVSEHVAWSSARFQRIFDEALDACGLPRELVHIVNGYAETGRALIAGGVDLVVFTGSMPNGKKVLAEAAKHITPVILELGGKDAMIVCDDAELDQAVHAAMGGVFIACGQNCLAAERILVMDGVYDDFVTRVGQMARELRQGPPLAGGIVDCGAMVTEPQLGIVEGLVQDAVDKGARVLAGGERGNTAEGYFFQPTVLADVTPDMRIFREETFGPVMCIVRVHDDQHALRIANDSEYGLSSTIFSRDARRAKRLADRIVAGSSTINDFGLSYMAMDLPFGGVKGSGFGRLNGRDGLRACTNNKAVLEDRIALHQPNKLFPVAEGTYDAVRGVLHALYGRGLRRKLRGARDLLKAR